MPLPDVLAAMDQDYRDRLKTFELYRDYLDGKHRFDFASKRFRESYAWVLRAAQENLCPTIVDVYADKVEVADWGLPDDAGVDAETLDRLLAMSTQESYGMGNAFGIVWNSPVTGKPAAAFQRADQCIPVVDPENPTRLSELGKVWRDRDGRTRLNVYDHERLTRWVSRDKQTTTATNGSGDLLLTTDRWVAYEADGQPHEEPHDFGVVPAVWWKRKAPDAFSWGRSVLADAVPVQDELNKIAADTIASSERVALPLRYVMDVAPELLQPKLNRDTGRLEPPKIPFDESVNSILALTAKGPAGQFASPDAASLIKLQEHAEDKLARVTGIPVFYLRQTSGDAPSGESLRVVSSRLVSGVRAFTRDNTPTWNGLLELLGIPEPAITWADPMPLSTEERLANASEAKALGLPVDEWLREGGYDPNEVDDDGQTLADRVRAAMQTKAQDVAGLLYAGEGAASY